MDLYLSVANLRMLCIFSESDIYFRIYSPYRATFDVTNLHEVLIERIQVTLRQVVGAHEVQSVFTEREDIALEIAEIVGNIANKWGVAIEYIFIKDITSSANVSSAASIYRESVRESGVIATETQTVKSRKTSPNILRKVKSGG